MMYHSSLFIRLYTRFPVSDRESVKQMQLALHYLTNHVMKNIHNLDERCFLAFLSLTNPESDTSSVTPASPKSIFTFIPPLAHLQWLHITGRRPFVEGHYSALQRIIE